MMKPHAYALLLAGLILMPVARAESVQVSNVWTRATAPSQKVAGVYMDLTANAEMRLTGASSPACGRVELHTMRMEGGMMVMRPVPDIPLPKGQTISLKPGGLHIMCIDIKQPLKLGGRVPLTLQVRGGSGEEQRLQVEAEVRSADEGRPMQHRH